MAIPEFSGEIRPKVPAFNDGLDDFYDSPVEEPIEPVENHFETAFEADLADFTESVDRLEDTI